MKLKVLLAILVITLNPGCSQQKKATSASEEAVTEPEKEPVSYDGSSEILKNAIEAHGGYASFKKYSTIEFDVLNWPFSQNAPLNDHHTVDLQNRKAKITSETYMLGFDGSEVWIQPDDSVLGVPSDFYYGTPFYFIGMPFLFADPGATVEDMGQEEFDGKLYDAIKVSYGDGVGKTSDDNYIVYFDAETHQIKLSHYLVTHPAFSGGKKPEELPRFSVVYDDLQTVNGITVPHGFTFYPWNEGALGDPYGSASFENVKFMEEPKESHFYADPTRSRLE